MILPHMVNSCEFQVLEPAKMEVEHGGSRPVAKIPIYISPFRWSIE